jgi:hypothetical protein
MPEDGSTKGRSIWFTLNALTVAAAGLENDFPDTPEGMREYNLRLLGDKDYFITTAPDMIARIEDFNRHELLEWTVLFIKVHLGDSEPILVEGTAEEFAGTNPHAREVGRINEAFASGVPEEDVINYHPEDTDDSNT